MKPILILSLALFAGTAFGQAFKWRDAEGRIQYSDTPPPANARDVQQLRKPPGTSAPTSAPQQRTIDEQAADFRKRRAEAEEARAKQAKAEEEERVRSANCEQAKGQVAAIRDGQRMTRFNQAGERVVLEDADRARALAEAERAVESWCAPQPPRR